MEYILEPTHVIDEAYTFKFSDEKKAIKAGVKLAKENNVGVTIFKAVKKIEIIADITKIEK